MSQPTTLAVSRVLSALGLKGGGLPEMGLESYQPVVLMGDFSHSLASEPVEARGFAAGVVAFVPANRSFFQLQCVSGGGLILELILMDCTNALGQNVLVIQTGTSPFLVAPAAVPKLDVGGRPTRSVCSAETRIQVVPPSAILMQNPGSVPFDLSPLRWYLKPGWFIEFSNAFTEELRYTIAWRELEEPVGAP